MSLMVSAQTTDSPLSQQDESSISDLIATGEAETALQRIESDIRDIATEHGRSSPMLIEPFILRGDAFYALGFYDAALETYDDARSLQRRHFGLHDLSQTDVLYKEAQTLFAQEQFTEANDSQEYAFSIYLRKYGDKSPKILPGLFKLADWYMDTNNIFTARGLYEKVLVNFDSEHAEIEENAEDELSAESDQSVANTESENTEESEEELEERAIIDDESRIRALSGLAMSYRNEKFRPSDFSAQSEKFTTRPYGAIYHPEHYYPTLNDFAKGEQALLEIIKLQLLNENPESHDLAHAKLQLADWYLLFEKYEHANVVYKDIWDTLEGTPEFSFVEEHMMTPHALYQPLPSDPPKPATRSSASHNVLEGKVAFTFSVTDKGIVENVEQVSGYPGRLLGRATREAAENSIYRPAFTNGVAMRTEVVNFVHTFPYYIEARGSRYSN